MDSLSLGAYWGDKICAALVLLGAVWGVYKRGDIFRLKLTSIIVLSFLGLFVLLRIALWKLFPGIFAGCETIGWSFFQGIRFDLAALAACAGLWILLVNIPVKWEKYYRICLLLAAITFSIVTLLGIGDIVYFYFVKRHVGTEFLLMFNDLNLIGEMAVSKYIWLGGIWVLYSVFLVWGSWKKWGIKGQCKRSNIKIEIFSLCLIACLIFFGIRGIFGFRMKPITPQLAYESGSLACGHLVLNGVFNTYKSISKKYAPVNNLVSSQEAVKYTKKILYSPQEIYINEQYPLLRTRKTFNIDGKGKNILILILESWESKYTDSLSNTTYNATPNLDELIHSGLVFTNFYASGQRSINGVGTILTGIPQLPGLPYYSLGLESYPVLGLGKILNKKGYRTIFVQPSDWRSARVGLVAELAGFEEIYTRPDITSLGHYEKEGTVSDYDALIFLAEQLKGTKKPFLGVFFSSAMHPPFDSIRKEFNKFPTNGPDGGYLNALNYTDWAIGEFIKELKANNLYDQTILFVVADHTLGWGENGSFDNRFKIPFFIHSPNLVTPGTVETVSSQADIFPTVLDVLNISAPYVALGGSVFDQNLYNFAFTSMDGRILGWKEDASLIEHSGKKIVFKDSSEEKTKNMETRLLSFTRAAHDLIKQGKWVPVQSLEVYE